MATPLPLTRPEHAWMTWTTWTTPERRERGKRSGLVLADHCTTWRVWLKLACRGRSAHPEPAGDEPRPPTLEEEAHP